MTEIPVVSDESDMKKIQRSLMAQNTGIQRTLVKKGDVSIPGREAVVARRDRSPSVRPTPHPSGR
jgi:hypothetical protein